MIRRNYNTRYFSNKQEKNVAKTVGGKKTANSGATSFIKGDVIIPNTMLIECKTTTKEQKSFTIQKEWIKKNKEEAFQTGLPYSALAFDFGDQKEQFYVVDLKLFNKLVELLKRENEDF